MHSGETTNFYGAWYGDFAAWAGASWKVTEKATINGQVAYEDEGTVAAALNVAYELVPGFTITPEIAYTSFDDETRFHDGDDAFAGIIRFQRNF